MTAFFERLRARWRSVTLLVTAAGVVMGFVGLGQMDPTSSILDRLYGALQLLVLSGPTGLGVENLPLALSWGRFVAAIGLASTVIALSLRVGASRADEFTARRAKGHSVVIGSTAEATGLAMLRARRDDLGRPHAVVLVGNIDEEQAALLRRQGVRVVPYRDGSRLKRVVVGAEEVLIADTDDGGANAIFREVVQFVGESSAFGPHPPSAIRLLVHSTSFARTLRATYSNATEGAMVVSALSIVEAASHQLSGKTWLPTPAPGADLHLVVIGDGALARETVVSAVQRRSSRTNLTVVDLWPVGSHDWCDEVRDRVSSRSVEVRAFPQPPTMVHLAREVSLACRDDKFGHRVFVVGVPDSDAITIGMRLAASTPRAKVVTVQSVRHASGSGQSNAGEVWRATTLAELLSEPELWAIDEQVGREILEGLEVLAHLPGAKRELELLQPLLRLSRSDAVAWAGTVSAGLRRDLANSGLHVAPSDDASEPLTLMSEVLLAMRSTLQHSFSRLGVAASGQDGMTAVLSVVQDIPEMLRRCGYALSMGAHSSLEHGLTPEVVELLAQRIHSSYLRIAERLEQSGAPASAVDWEHLPPDLQESSRAQARDLPIKLMRLGYRVVPEEEAGATMPNLSDEIVERMAWHEHLRWMYSRVSNGWQFGSVRDDQRRHHPLIVPFEELPEDQREQDRGPVRLLPELLRLAGLAVKPLPG